MLPHNSSDEKEKRKTDLSESENSTVCMLIHCYNQSLLTDVSEGVRIEAVRIFKRVVMMDPHQIMRHLSGVIS